jgi:tetratricopeptide (TPR) repeat protein
MTVGDIEMTTTDPYERWTTLDPARELFVFGKRKTLLFDIEGYMDAVPLFLQALELSPKNPLIYAALAQTYAYWGGRREINGQECLTYYQLAYDNARQALDLGAELADPHRAMAAALRSGEMSDAAARKREAARAMELDPYDGENCYEFWRANGSRADDPLIAKAIALNPVLCGAHNDLGVALCEQERLQEAYFHLKKALKLNPRNSLFQYNMAMICFREGLRLEAEKILREALELHPNDPLVQSGVQLAAAEEPEGVPSL